MTVREGLRGALGAFFLGLDGALGGDTGDSARFLRFDSHVSAHRACLTDAQQ